jgi:hypothetical protein
VASPAVGHPTARGVKHRGRTPRQSVEWGGWSILYPPPKKKKFDLPRIILLTNALEWKLFNSMKSISEVIFALAALRGQTYDGASSISGQYKGRQALINEKQPLALDTHCGDTL